LRADQPLSYERFSSEVAVQLELDCDMPIKPSDGLFTDLALDSLQAFELIVVIEQLAGLGSPAGGEVPSNVLPIMLTMQDAFVYYETLMATPR